MNKDLKFSLKWAFSGVVIGLIAFIYNYTMAPISLPGYEILAWPAMFGLQFFSEETAFWPKFIIFITSQYLAYFLMIFTFRKILRLYQSKH
ncbi:hypothetical protein [Thalassotalea sp. SU-HH00458]|uniref:hypothetical protein n=1 Tax=Thalassotalea sp. SU-HH00458 TaxID=3127657 RepID=UPI0031084EA4